MDNTDAFGHTKYGRPDGHDNISLSTTRDSIRNIDPELSGNTDGSCEMPTGKHSRCTTSVGTGMFTEFFKINNNKINDYFPCNSNNNGDTVGNLLDSTTGIGSLFKTGNTTRRTHYTEIKRGIEGEKTKRTKYISEQFEDEGDKGKSRQFNRQRRRGGGK